MRKRVRKRARREREKESESEREKASKMESEKERVRAHKTCMPLSPPQIPVFPFKSNVNNGELKSNLNRSLGGDGDVIGRGGRLGCEEGVSRENTTPILTNRFGANFTSPSKTVCKFGDTRSGTLVLKNVPGSAKSSGMGHSKNSHGEIVNSVTYIPSPSRSSKSIGNSTHLSSGVRNVRNSDVHNAADGNTRNSLEVRNRLGSSPRSSPHNMTTVSPNTQDIIKQPVELHRHVKTRSRGDIVGVSEKPDEGADSKAVKKIKKEKEESKKKKKLKKEVQKNK